MEINIVKKLFTTVEIPCSDDVTDAELSKEISKIVKNMELEDWDTYDWRGKEVYEAYDAYSGIEIELNF